MKQKKHSLRGSTVYARFKKYENNPDALGVYCWLQKFENLRLESTANLDDLARDLEINHFKSTNDFHQSYKLFKEHFQKKYQIYFSFLDGNHRSTVISKLMENEPFTDYYIKGDNDQCYELDGQLQERIYSLFTVDIE